MDYIQIEIINRKIQRGLGLIKSGGHIIKVNHWCEVCGLCFEGNKMTHYREHHPEYKFITDNLAKFGNTRYFCGTCNKGVSNYAALVKHYHEEHGK